MTNPDRRWVPAACGLAVVGALVAGMAVGEGERSRERPVLGAARSGLAAFTISGDVPDLITPGVGAGIDLEFSNRHFLSLSVSGIHVDVRRVDAPHADRAHPCTVADFAVEQVPQGTEVRIPAREKRTLDELGLPRRAWPQLVLVNRPVDQDGCRGASVVLSYRASGTVAR